MKKIFLIFLSLATLNACKKKEKKQTVEPVAQDIPETFFKTQTITGSVDLYNAVALEQDGALFCYYNKKTNKGQININDRLFDLYKVTNYDGVYTFQGNGVTVRTDACNYANKETDCAYGSFNRVLVTFDTKTQIVQGITLKDCSND